MKTSMLMLKRSPLTVPQMERMRLPESVWRAKIEKVPESCRHEVSEILRRIPKFFEIGPGIWIDGDTGAGKSSVAALIGMEGCAWGGVVYYTTLWELREGIRARRMFDEEQSLLDRCMNVELLILDDVTAIPMKDAWFGESDLTSLLSFRLSKLRPTILVSSLPERLIEKEMPFLAEIRSTKMMHFHVRGPDRSEEELKARRAELIRPKKPETTKKK